MFWNNMLNEAMTDKAVNERRMNGPAAAAKGGIDEIAQMRQQLNDGIVEFEFTKADSTLRHAVGTTSETVIPTAECKRLDPNYDDNLASYMRRQAFIIWFWDLEKNEVRCFNTNRFERIINVERVNHKIGNIQQVGNIFIHRDVDQNEDIAHINQDRVEEINRELDREPFAGKWEDAVPGAGNLVNWNQIRIIKNNQHEPILRIVINKRGNENDPPYQICVNEIRRAILERFNVEVRHVEITGQIEY